MSKLEAIVIDDDPVMCEIIGSHLQSLGFTAVKAHDGVAGIETLYAMKDPILAIVDIIMPQKEGIETIMEIRANFPKIRVIAISGGGSLMAEELLLYARRLGAHAIFKKPIDLEELSMKAIDLIRRREETQQTLEQIVPVLAAATRKTN